MIRMSEDLEALSVVNEKGKLELIEFAKELPNYEELVKECKEFNTRLEKDDK